MNVTDHARAAALLRVLTLHHIARSGDRVLVSELEGSWKSEIGLRRDDLLDAIDRMLIAGRFVHCTTLSGAALQLTDCGERELGREPPTPGRSRIGQLLDRLLNHWNTFFVLRTARRRTLTRLRFVGTPADGEPRRRTPAESRAELLSRAAPMEAPSWTPPRAAPGATPSRALPAGASSRATTAR